ncbi:MAG: hypothetical protein COA71_09100 [SAR86 cluster bacterium]|uniref:Uncharacterized protein n=1 Tax=SAR86 cluster bacterium TaxID=2030880 RepID=A0A2A5CBF7_9GAMM|nr:MAG: hypothetical protein COA71_09100 [SAR86 cluster bacterium]
MIDRRTTLKFGAAGMLGSLANLPAQSLGAISSKARRLPSQAIFDGQYSESRAFAETLESYGATTIDLRGDLGKLWYGQLRSRLLEERKPLFGLTNRLDLFCLEELARDVDMKVSLRFDHLIHQNGFVEHQVAGSSLLRPSIEHLGHKAGFGKTMAELSEFYLTDEPQEVSVQKLTGPYAPLNKTALVTWVIS